MHGQFDKYYLNLNGQHWEKDQIISFRVLFIIKKYFRIPCIIKKVPLIKRIMKLSQIMVLACLFLLGIYRFIHITEVLSDTLCISAGYFEKG